MCVSLHFVCFCVLKESHIFRSLVNMMLQRKKEINFTFLFIYKGEEKFMASASLSSKPPCATCGNKSVGVFKCEGCLQTFCRKHSNEHRDSLSHQLDEIVLEHDTLQQTIVEQKEKQSDRHHLIEHIDKWGKESIVKIQKTAEDARQQVETFIAAENGNRVKTSIIIFLFYG